VRYDIGRPGFRTRQITLVTTLLDAESYRVADLAELYRQRWQVEVCQTQPIKMPRCPLRNGSRTMTSLRGQYTRERIGDIHLLPGDDDVSDQALRDCLAFFTGEPVQIVTPQMPKGFGVLHDLLPRPRLLRGTSERLPCLRDLFSCGRECPPSTVQRIEAEDLSLIGIASALAWPLQALLALKPLGLLSRQGGAMVWFGVGPGLRPRRHHRRRVPQLAQCRPDYGLAPVGTPASGEALRHPSTRQGRVTLARIVEGLLGVADAPLAGTGHRQPACPTVDQPPQSGPAGGRLRRFAGQLGSALPVDRRFRAQLT
jgi:hypothetical protein